MIYPDSFEEKIGFDAIRRLLKEECVSSMGSERVDELQYSTDYETIQREIDETEEFRSVLLFGDNFVAEDYFDLSPIFSRIHIAGTFIELDELVKLRGFIKAIIDAVVYFRIAHEEGKYPRLWTLCEPILLEKNLLEAINKLLDAKGNLRDNASEKLRQIKSDIIRISKEADNKIRKLLNSAKEDGLVKDDAEMTIRNGRLCIPVPAQFKRRLRGFIHDESATGQTVFIEPTEVFDANNELKDLLNAEKREIIRILTEITDQIRPSIPNLLIGQEFLGHIDFIRAKAKLAIRIQAVKPNLFDKPMLNWERAIHPLLYLNFKEHHKEVQPLDMHLDDQQRILIISGPNAGGKSVCLKTVGLLQYMIQCGLLVPMKESSDMGILDSFFIDMGDEQSIDNDLSTYSSHLKNLKTMVENLNARSLFLIDEFGSGTEPTLGGAMAEALLETIYETKAFGIITTHYGNLKMFPNSHSQAVNGAMLFDVHAIKPLFQLRIGKPGSSFTYEIAKKIGLPDSIIENALSKSGTAQIDYERMLEEIEVEKIETDKRMKMVQQADEKLAELIQQYNEKFKEFDKIRKEILQKAKNQATNIVESANKVIENTIREIKESKADSTKTKAARKEINELKKELNTEIENIDTEDIIKPILPKKSIQKETPRLETDFSKIEVGDSVFIENIQTVGEVTKISGDDITVSFNSISFKTTLDKVQKISKKESRAVQRGTKLDGGSLAEAMNKKVSKFQTTLDLRGQRGEDAITELEFYIDEAVLLSIHQVRILHGKGNGILRNLVRQYLAKQKSVKSFDDERLEFGGSGITVVEL
ncbi:MAG: Smr/MutS family protein [Bacteroidales bacterium]|nr:Smr/MutS family protein [Bacteroidales bacterium]